jgi:hypothetical protein
LCKGIFALLFLPWEKIGIQRGLPGGVGNLTGQQRFTIVIRNYLLNGFIFVPQIDKT